MHKLNDQGAPASPERTGELCPATAGRPSEIYRRPLPGHHHETSDSYARVIAHLDARYRVIVCKDGIQWIVQARRGARHGQPRWEAQHYCTTRAVLLRLGHAACGAVDPEALAVLHALPEWIGGGA